MRWSNREMAWSYEAKVNGVTLTVESISSGGSPKGVSASPQVLRGSEVVVRTADSCSPGGRNEGRDLGETIDDHAGDSYRGISSSESLPRGVSRDPETGLFQAT